MLAENEEKNEHCKIFAFNQVPLILFCYVLLFSSIEWSIFSCVPRDFHFLFSSVIIFRYLIRYSLFNSIAFIRQTRFNSRMVFGVFRWILFFVSNIVRHVKIKSKSSYTSNNWENPSGSGSKAETKGIRIENFTFLATVLSLWRSWQTKPI